MEELHTDLRSALTLPEAGSVGDSSPKHPERLGGRQHRGNLRLTRTEKHFCTFF